MEKTRRVGVLTKRVIELLELELPEGKEELTGRLSQVLEERLDELWESGVLDQERLDEVRGMHLRTELFL